MVLAPFSGSPGTSIVSITHAGGFVIATFDAPITWSANPAEINILLYNPPSSTWFNLPIDLQPTANSIRWPDQGTTWTLISFAGQPTELTTAGVFAIPISFPIT